MKPDQQVMGNAADTIAELRAKVESLEKSLKETQEELERQQALDAIDEDHAREMADQLTAELQERIEFLEADRARLSALIHPDTPGCDVVAGKCHWCDVAIKGRDADVRALCDAVTQLMPTSRTLKPLVEKVRKGQ